MQSFFSMPAGPKAGAPAGAPSPSPAMNFFGNLVARGNARMGKVGKPNKKQTSLLAVVGGILMVMALAYLSERKWGALTRVQLRTLGPIGFKQLKSSAKQFRNEVFKMNKRRNPALSADAYLSNVLDFNRTLRATFSDNFKKDHKDVKDMKTKEELWEKYMQDYSEISDMSLQRDAANEMVALKHYLKGLDFNKEDKIDEDDWETLFEFDMPAFLKWGKKFVADENNKDEAERVKFYMEHMPKFLAARANYVMHNNVALSWLDSRHSDAKEAHPDADNMKTKAEKEKEKKAKKEKDEDDSDDEEGTSWKDKALGLGSKIVGERGTAMAAALKNKVGGFFGAKAEDGDDDLADG